jgi:uncharacterized protein (TIGR00266 family)
MNYEIMYHPSYSLAIVKLEAGEFLSAGAGTMVSMSDNIVMETKGQKGVLGMLKRSVLGEEYFFINTFRAEGGSGEITFAPPFPGDILCYELYNETIYVQSGSYIGSSPDIAIDTRWNGSKSFFSRESQFLLKISGNGPLFVASYGAMYEKNLAKGEKYLIDTGHLVAFTHGVAYTIKRVGGLKPAILGGGEGVVCEFTGPGRIFLQTRSEDAFLAWLLSKLPRK